MRQIININNDWIFHKQDTEQIIDLPHTWNAVDGTDGGNDYYRGACWYTKEYNLNLENGQNAFIEFCAVNSSAEVYINGQLATKHDGGYSIFRADITSYAVYGNNKIAVKVDNSPSRTVYPQRADFTFYGGIYRDVNLIITESAHFDLNYFGASGIKVTPKVNGDVASVNVETFVVGKYDDIKVTVDNQTLVGNDVTFTINNPHLWRGIEDAFLYLAKAELYADGKVVDSVSVNFGIREFHIDPNLGFFLNGKSYPLRGVAKHQDFAGVGNATTREMMERDMELILETGANTIRLAHYQHDQYVYDLCDKYGMCVWAEIPYISEHMPTARANAISQMTELVAQNYNHPSIICWGLSNEITICGESDDLVDNHVVLNDLCHQLDSTRPTAMACVSILDSTSKLLDIPDILSYNLYFGWYNGKTADNDAWFDNFHKNHPNTCIGFSEYGADSVLSWHNSNPKASDYTEEYQAIYHEDLLKTINDRPYIWASHMWNMFDFGADGRSEGGEAGQNHKGLVTFDRKIKKDAFYIYKAYFSKEPFVHICGRRYIDRAEEVTTVKVYSNQPQVSLYNNGKLIASKNGDKIFTFEVTLSETNDITATAGELFDSIVVKKVAEPNPNYVLKKAEVTNWFSDVAAELPQPAGYFSVFDKMGDVFNNPEADKAFCRVLAKSIAKMGMAQMDDEGYPTMPEVAKKTLYDFKHRSVFNMLSNAGQHSKDEVAELNCTLNKIKK